MQCLQSRAVVDRLKVNRCAEHATQNEKTWCSRKVEDTIQAEGIFSLFGEFQLILADDERCESAAIRRLEFDEASDLIWPDRALGAADSLVSSVALRAPCETSESAEVFRMCMDALR